MVGRARGLLLADVGLCWRLEHISQCEVVEEACGSRGKGKSKLGMDASQVQYKGECRREGDAEGVSDVGAQEGGPVVASRAKHQVSVQGVLPHCLCKVQGVCV